MRSKLTLRGQRLTRQRALLLELLREGRGHWDADELYMRAKKRYSKISLSTVYRCLKLFKTLGLIHELHLKEEHHHYEGRAVKGHYHLVCLSCGKIMDFDSPEIQRMKEGIQRDKGFEVKGAEISGICPSCR